MDDEARYPRCHGTSAPQRPARRAAAWPGAALQGYSHRIATVEPVSGNIRHNKRRCRSNVRGREKVNTHWHLYCMMHNIEKLANSGWGQ